MPRKKACAAAAAALAWILSTAVSASAAGLPAETIAVTVESRPISAFKIGSSLSQFGQLDFIGGLELWSSHPRFGSLSGLRFTTPGRQFVGVSDTGFVVSGEIGRDATGTPSDMRNFAMVSIAALEGRPEDAKEQTDAEGVALRSERLVISFERTHRISEYSFPSGLASLKFLRDIPFLVPAHELRRNRGFEALAISPSGEMIAITEKSLDGNGDIFASIIGGPSPGIFKVKRRDGFDVTDGVFLPDGDLVILERYYAVARGVKIRLRRIDGMAIRAGALVDGPVLLTADMGYQIDNMEGMDVWRREDGATILSLISDDNQSLLQRNLYLEFRLHADRPAVQ